MQIKKIFFLLLLFYFTLSAFTQSVSAADSGYYHTYENKIINESGEIVRITGVNWFGMETDTFAPHGLWIRGYKEMMDQMKRINRLNMS